MPMRLSIRHLTAYRYDPPAAGAVMLLRLRPDDHDGQRVEHWRVTVNGEAVEGFARNAYGDFEALWRAGERIELAEIVAEGTVTVTDMAGVVRGFAPMIHPHVFLRETPLTRIDAAIEALALDAASEEGPLASLHALNALVNQRVAYRSGTTFPETTAAQALELGSGVCQDHAHVFIAAARAIDIPARYVAGYMLSGPDGEALHQTHGWAEAYVQGLGWTAFDPANAICPTDHYVRLSCGLDAHDAAPVRGVAMMAGTIAIEADVDIGPVLAQSQGQAQ
jgi:transglutaminase-like putative cysteine protease